MAAAVGTQPAPKMSVSLRYAHAFTRLAVPCVLPDGFMSNKASIKYISSSAPEFSRVVELADSASATLGFMPRRVMAASADAGTLVIAKIQDDVAGYALFGLPKNFVRLTHLRVAPAFQGRGIARLLVNELSRRYEARRGVRAKCRRDYGLTEMWSRLGFRPLYEIPGRGRRSQPLVVLWRDHGHADLFSDADTPSLVTAAIDLSVLRHLAEPARSAHRDSHVLISDHVQGQLKLVATPALSAEIDQIEEGGARVRYLSIAYNDLAERRAAPGESDEALGYLSRNIEPHLASETIRARHLAEASAASVSIIITEDRDFIESWRESAAALLNIRLLGPVDAILYLDELARADAYRPAALLGTDIIQRDVSVAGDLDLSQFVSSWNGEHRSDLLTRIRASVGAHSRCTVLQNSNGKSLALIVHGNVGRLLSVPVLRLAPDLLADTLARQLFFQLRQLARRHADVIRIEDPYISEAAQRAALEDGFRKVEQQYWALVIDQAAEARDIEAAVERATSGVSVDPAVRLRPSLPAEIAAEWERALWPAKIIDSRLLTYMVPIQPRWSAGLFGIPTTLPVRPTELGISREQVYYRSPRGLRLSAPARILWYMSQGSPERPRGAIVATSMLEQVVVEAPDVLHARFRHLGVWRLDDILGVSREGLAQALRVVNTEPFNSPIDRRDLAEMAATLGLRINVQGPTRVPSELFAALYNEGMKPNG